jgi:hypothetical protein
VATALPPVLAYWREFGARYVTAVCARPDVENREHPPIPALPIETLEAIASSAPPMTGAEYLTPSVLQSLWDAIDAAFRVELAESKVPIQNFLQRKNQAWNLVGRVHFNLAENRSDDEAPFAFLATFTTRLSAHAKAQHLPLGRALSEYAGAANRSRLLSPLLPVQRAAGQCPWLKAMVDAGEIFHPLRWTPAEALQLLTDLPRLESAGVVVRVPGTWRANRPPRPQVSMTLGSRVLSGLGRAALLDFRMEVTLDGERLTRAEIAKLLAASDGLHLVRGRWVEVDRDKLKGMLEEFRQVERTAKETGLTFAEAMRLLAGATVSDAEAARAAPPDWSRVVAGPWLAKILEELRHPESITRVDAGDALKTSLRPYQQAGVRWLHLLSGLGLGACLADDMGLGKTMQVLALLLILRRAGDEGGRRTSILVAPASLIANWASEIARFAPSLRALIAHPSEMPSAELRAVDQGRLENVDLVITSYGTLMRTAAIPAMAWRLAVLDEAQAIKNPGARQTRAAKQLDARARIALTGTPVENRLGDLWFRLHQPGPARLRQGVRALHQAPRGEAAKSLRTAARAGASLHSQASEDGHVGDRRFAGQNGGQEDSSTGDGRPFFCPSCRRSSLRLCGPAFSPWLSCLCRPPSSPSLAQPSWRLSWPTSSAWPRPCAHRWPSETRTTCALGRRRRPVRPALRHPRFPLRRRQGRRRQCLTRPTRRPAHHPAFPFRCRNRPAYAPRKE